MDRSMQSPMPCFPEHCDTLSGAFDSNLAGVFKETGR